MQNRKKLSFSVNQKPYSLALSPDMPLLWALRDVLHLSGTKYGCGTGQCGVCTVLIDDQAEFSCQLTVAQIEGKNITTIEGIAEGDLSRDGLHRVQQAWLDAQVPQCGYCQSGQIMTAVALLRKQPTPRNEEIDRMMSRVLCRCGTYSRVRQALTQLIKPASSSSS